MSVVHVNSISGITSITSPSSSDVLTLHTSNNTERFRIDSTGRLLLGTQKTYGSASYYDDITINNSNGSGASGGTGITLISSTNSWNSIYFGDSDNHGVGAIKYDHNTNSMRFVVNATDPAVFINSNGFLGISTATVSAPLHAFNATNNTIARLESGDATCRLQLKDSAGEVYVEASGDDLVFATTSSITPRLTITSDGTLKMPEGTNDIRLGDNTDSNAGTQTISVGSMASGKSGGIQIWANSTNGNSFIQFGDGTASANHYRGFINYRHGDDTLRFGTGGNDRVIIDLSGNIGQGVTPSGWASDQAGDFYAYQVGSGMAIFGRGSGDEDRGGISCNYYHTASAQKYIGNGHAGRIYFEDGSIVFSNTGSTPNAAGAGAALTLYERLKIEQSGLATFANGISFGPHHGHTNDENVKMHMYSDDNINDGVNFSVAIQFGNANNGPFMIELYQAHSHYTGTASYCKILGSYGASDAAGGGCSFLVLEKQGYIDTGSVFAVTDNSTTTQRTNNTDYTITIAGKSASSNTGTSLKNKTYVIVYSRTIPASVVFA